MWTETFRAYLLVAVFSLVYGVARFSSTLEASRALNHGDAVDPATLHLYGEFIEDNLGAARAADGSVTIRIIAQKYVFVPACVSVPAGAAIRLRITAADAAHGFKIAGTEVKTVPGSVTEVHISFPAAGEYEFHCDEFCGPGHHSMMGRVVAVPEKEFQAAGLEHGDHGDREGDKAACGQR